MNFFSNLFSSSKVQQEQVDQQIQRNMQQHNDDLVKSDQFDPLKFPQQKQDQSHKQDQLLKSDQFDPLKSAQLQKSDLIQNQSRKSNYKFQSIQNKIKRNQLYPALAKQDPELLQIAHSNQNHSNLQQNNNNDNQDKNKRQQLKAQEEDQQQEDNVERQQKDSEENFNKEQETQFNQFQEIEQTEKMEQTQKMHTQQKFARYLNEEINKDKQKNQLINKKLYEALNSPIQRNISLKSNQSTSYYNPEQYSLNLSRSYIPNFRKLSNPTIYQNYQQQSKTSIQKKLRQIFDYYSQSYIQPTKNYQTFDSVKNRIINFQSFCLFAKDFKILKTMISLETIKRLYKKHSQFGKTLKFINFYNLIESLACEKQCNQYFNINKMVPDMNKQTKQQLQKQQFYIYLGLYDTTQSYKNKFSQVFHPFLCQKQAELPKIKYNYRRFSQTDLHKKALPEVKQKKPKKNVIVLKINQKYQPSPFEQVKSIVVSWQAFKSARSAPKLFQNYNLNLKRSTQIVKKYVKQEAQDKIYLKQYRNQNQKSMIKNINPSVRLNKEKQLNTSPSRLSLGKNQIQNSNDPIKYNTKQSSLKIQQGIKQESKRRLTIQKKIKQIKQLQDKKNKAIISRIQQKINVMQKRKR